MLGNELTARYGRSIFNRLLADIALLENHITAFRDTQLPSY